MTSLDFIALMPHLAIAIGSTVVLLVISFWRDVRVAFALTLLVLLLGLTFIGTGVTHTPHVIAEFLIIDGYSAFMSALFIVAAIVTAVLARAYLRGRSGELEEFYLLLLLATLGAMTMASANHFGAFVLGLELLSISLYVLIGYAEEGHPPLEAALKYLVLSGVASTTMLFGIALIYNATGTLVPAELAALSLTAPRAELYVLAGQGLLVAGIAFKLSIIPFHMWTPDVYQGAPAPVAGYLASVSKGAAFAFLLRYVLVSDTLASVEITSMIGLFAVLSMLGGNLLALLQDNVKRMLAYSSIAHMGYLLVGLLAVASLSDRSFAAEASMIYLTGYVLMTLAAFGVVSVLSGSPEEADAQNLGAYAGLFWRRPLPATILTVALLSLTGIPLTAGFIVKFYLLAAGVMGGMWVLLWALLIGSAIAVYYYLRVILTMLATQEAEPYAHPGSTPDGTAALVVIGIALVLFGAYPTPLIDIVRGVLGTAGG